jgi:hypothetical protein
VKCWSFLLLVPSQGLAMDGEHTLDFSSLQLWTALLFLFRSTNSNPPWLNLSMDTLQYPYKLILPLMFRNRQHFSDKY